MEFNKIKTSNLIELYKEIEKFIMYLNKEKIEEKND